MIIAGTAAGLRREARIQLDAFADNLRSLTAELGSFVLDVRADAYGHSLDLIVPICREFGIAGYLTSSPGDAPPAGVPVVAAAAYGLDPLSATRPVMTLVGEVVAVKPVPSGSGVSYGYSYRTSRDTVLSLVGLGYADGVPRLASNRSSVRIGVGRHPIVGRVAMDQFVVETGTDSVRPGDDAVLFGDPDLGHPTAHEWAALTARTALQLTAGVGPRVRRIAVDRHG